MSNVTHKFKLWLLAAAALFVLGGVPAHGASVTLFLEITSELQNGAGNPLSDGSVIYVIGTSGDGVMPMQTWGDAFFADSVTGDNVIIATLSLNSLSTGVDGTMVAAFTVNLDVFDVTDVGNQIYLRFFNYQDSPPPAGPDIEWGTTPPVSAYPIFAGALYGVDIPGAQVSATNRFVVIPEPGTFDLYLVAAVLISLLGVRRGERTLRHMLKRGAS